MKNLNLYIQEKYLIDTDTESQIPLYLIRRPRWKYTDEEVQQVLKNANKLVLVPDMITNDSYKSVNLAIDIDEIDLFYNYKSDDKKCDIIGIHKPKGDSGYHAIVLYSNTPGFEVIPETKQQLTLDELFDEINKKLKSDKKLYNRLAGK